MYYINMSEVHRILKDCEMSFLTNVPYVLF